MTIDLVVFDMAGTTVSEGGAVYRCLRDTLAARGHEVTGDDIKGVRGLDKRDALRERCCAAHTRTRSMLFMTNSSRE